MKEIRIIPINAESRAADPAGKESLVLTGLPIVYDMPTVINDPKGQYVEIIKRGALDGADLSDARLLYNHDLNKVPLARTPKTMQLVTSAAGLAMSAELPDTQEARSIYEAVKRGDLSGMSFAFTVPEGGSTYDRETRTRTITKIKKVYEVSIVPFPAYPTTSVEARAQMDGGADPRTEELKKANKILFNQIMKERF